MGIQDIAMYISSYEHTVKIALKHYTRKSIILQFSYSRRLEMAESAGSFAIDRLFQMLEEESKLLKGVRREVESLRAELQIIQPYLRDADERAERGEIHDGLKALAKQVREVSYRIEDVMDGYILHLAQRRQRGGLMGFLRKIDRVITKLEQRHEIASEIQDIRTSIREIRERINTFCLRVIDDGSSSSRGWKSSASQHDSRMDFLFIDEAEVVGIESARDTLISWMVKEASSSRRMVISVVGTGGIGKTTLVKNGHYFPKIPSINCFTNLNMLQTKAAT